MTKLGKGSIVTNEAVLNFSSLFEPTESLSGAIRYTCHLLLDKSEKHKGLYKAYKKCTRTDLIRDLTYGWDAIRDGDLKFQENPDVYESYVNKIYIKCTSKYAPVLTDLRNGGSEATQLDLYDGCKVRGIIKPYAYKFDTAQGKEIAGVAWALLSIGLVASGVRTDKLGRSIQAFNEAIQND